MNHVGNHKKIKNMKTILKTITILSLFFALSCADKKETSSAESDYLKAHKKLQNKDYTGAAEDFKKISDEFPLSKWGIKAQTIAAYAFYQDDDLGEVITTADEFVKNHPSNPDVSYMLYLKSIAHYDQINNIQRAQDNARAASYSFRELTARFPSSNYADDARRKLIIVDDHIAGGTMSVGRYQMNNQNYVGAIKNFQEVVNNYSRTSQTPEAYFRLYELYKKIGINKEAEKYKFTLTEMYPDNYWTEQK